MRIVALSPLDEYGGADPDLLETLVEPVSRSGRSALEVPGVQVKNLHAIEIDDTVRARRSDKALSQSFSALHIERVGLSRTILPARSIEIKSAPIGDVRFIKGFHGNRHKSSLFQEKL
jgi:hypothetical protein